MADTANEQGGTHWLRLIVLVALAIGAIAAGRKWAMSKADAEFEQRLRLADERRD